MVCWTGQLRTTTNMAGLEVILMQSSNVKPLVVVLEYLRHYLTPKLVGKLAPDLAQQLAHNYATYLVCVKPHKSGKLL